MAKAILRDSAKDVVGSDPLQITWWAALSGAVTAAGAFGTAILDQVNVLPIPDPIKIAVIGLIGASIIGWAIASAGDALARAYATAHVTPKEEDLPKPAIQTAATALAEVYKAAHPAPADETAAGNAQARLVSLPVPLEVRVGNATAHAVLALVKEDKTIEYLVGLPGQQLDWKPEAAVQVAP